MTNCKLLKYGLFTYLCISSIALWSISLTQIQTLPLYGMVMVLYFCVQIVTCVLNRRQTPKALCDDDAVPTLALPSVSILVVGYREDPEYWRNCLLSIKAQEYPNIQELVVSIDGNDEGDQTMNHVAMDVLCGDDRRECTRVSILMNDHGGKRSAMFHGFKHIQEFSPDYIIVTDSDTIFQKDATAALVACIDKSPTYGCATGTLGVFSTHFLGRIVNARYGYAFNIERASMSYFGVMNCCSGPLSIYRSSLLDADLLELFLHQDCCGETCGPGDDRHLTCLIMGKGYKSKHTHHARALTEAPPNLQRFIIQQSRWIRSFYREIPWQVRSIGYQHPALAFITHFEVIYPFLVIGWVVYSLIHHTHFLRGVAISVGIIFIRTLILFVTMNFDPEMLLNMFYLPLYFFSILPVKIVGLVTIREMNWAAATRDGSLVKRTQVLPFLAITLWGGFLLATIGYKLYEIIVEGLWPSYT